MYISFIHVILIAAANISSLVLRNMPLVSGRIISTMVVRLTREINIATTLGLDDLALQCRNELAIALDRFQTFLTHYSQSQYPFLPFIFSLSPIFSPSFSFPLFIYFDNCHVLRPPKHLGQRRSSVARLCFACCQRRIPVSTNSK